MIAIPGLKTHPQGEMKELFEAWAEGDDSLTFKSAAWWEELLKKNAVTAVWSRLKKRSVLTLPGRNGLIRDMHSGSATRNS